MDKIIFVLILIGTTTEIIKCTDLQPDGTFRAYYSNNIVRDSKCSLSIDEVEQLSERANQIVTVEIS